MNYDDSTDLILNDVKSNDKLRNRDDSEYVNLNASTNSLLNKDLGELLSRVSISETEPKEQEKKWSIDNEEYLVSKYNDLLSDEKNYQDDTILAQLYNKIQVYLLRNKMSLDFLKMFKRYIFYIVQNGRDPITDDYLIKLSTQLDDGYEMTPKMNELISKILIDPETIEMKLVYFQFNSERRLVKNCFTQVQLHYILGSSLHKLEVEWKSYLISKYFTKWNDAHSFEALNGEKAIQFDKRRLLSYGFDNIYTYLMKIRSYNKAVDDYGRKKMFIAIKQNLERKKVMELKSDSLLAHNTFKLFMKNWKLNLKCKKYKPTSSYSKAQGFNRWVTRRQISSARIKKAEITRYVLVVQPIFKKWLSKINEKDKNYQRLHKLERLFILKKTLRTMIGAFKNQQMLFHVQSRLDDIQKKMVFEQIWKTRFQQKINLYSLQSIQEDRIKKNKIIKWSKIVKNRKKASNTYTKNLLKYSLRKWYYKSALINNDKFITRKSVQVSFDNWKLLYLRKKKIKNAYLHFILQKHMQKWKTNTALSLDREDKALAFYENCKQKTAFNTWHKKLTDIDNLTHKVSFFHNFKAFKRIQRKLALVNSAKHEMKNLKNDFNQKFLNLTFNFWLEKAQQSKDIRLNELLTIYKSNYKEKLLTKYFNAWTEKDSLIDECVKKAKYMRDYFLKEKLVNLIIQNINSRNELTEIASEIRSESLKHMTFHTWKETYKHSTKLEEIFQKELENKNVVLLLNYLNIMSMKMLKIQRNKEMITIFRARWDRAILRGLILLWKTRVQNSPKKVRLQRNRNLETPRRKITELTNSIPGSQLVKNYKVEAMKSRYSKVRHSIPSPIKNSSAFGSTIRKKVQPRITNVNESPTPVSPPKLNLNRRYNISEKNYTGLDFKRLPNIKLEPVVDRSQMEEDSDIAEFNESPTRKASRGL